MRVTPMSQLPSHAIMRRMPEGLRLLAASGGEAPVWSLNGRRLTFTQLGISHSLRQELIEW